MSEPTFRSTSALLGAGALAGALTVGAPIGLGTFVAAAGVAGAVAVQRPRGGTGRGAAFAGLALLLTATAMVTAAGWIWLLALLAAMAFGALAVAGGPSWAEVAGAVVAPVRASWAAARATLRSVRAPLDDAAVRRSAPVLRGAGLALVLVTVFGALFVTADRAFAELAERYLVPDIRIGLLPLRLVVGCATTLAAAALVSAPTRARRSPAPEATHGLGRTEWVTALVALDVLFAVFVAVQITVLFAGHSHVLETSGLTYAEYARRGFFQLLVAAGLTFGVIAGAVRWSRRDGDVHRRLLQVLLGVLCVLTLVVLASALRRLGLYEQAFGFTRARLFAHGTLLWFGALFLLVLVAGARWEARWLPRAAMVLTGVAVLAFSVIRPDAVVAEHNVQRYQETGRIDIAYLDGLSLDAVPALAQLPPHVRACVLRDDAVLLLRDEPWHAWNLSRRHARGVLRELGVMDQPCAVPAAGSLRHVR